MIKRKVFIGADHGGVLLKDAIVAMLASGPYEVQDLGTHGTQAVDYPDIASAVARSVVGQSANPAESIGIIVCGSGIGVSISANKVSGVRCALVHDAYTARMSRQHNNANMIALGERVTGIEVAKDAVNVFLNSEFEAGGRHEMRVGKINALDRGNC